MGQGLGKAGPVGFWSQAASVRWPGLSSQGLSGLPGSVEATGLSDANVKPENFSYKYSSKCDGRLITFFDLAFEVSDLPHSAGYR